ncbi:MAG TPA: hypothetical protein VFB66_08980 [Tepidisphaeraceae bacterium]|nr:hypothetical protein [Tepidisphaeraceae bacterium]
MSNRDARLRRELAALAYLDAFERGDLDALGAVWEHAAGDYELEQILCELVEGLVEEQEPSPGWHADADKVRGLLKTHLPSAEPPAPVSGPLTAGDVAARIAGDAGLLGKLGPRERQANVRLLADATPLPSSLGIGSLEGWAAALPVAVSAAHLRVFQQVAMMLTLGRQQPAGLAGITLAAARPQLPAGRAGSGESSPEQGRSQEPR